MPATHRIIRTPSGHTLMARVVPQQGLGTQLDAFFRERKCGPCTYIAAVMGEHPNHGPRRREGNRQARAAKGAS